ncbi:right-handed parallel beta-helix repeat-containing protein [Ideonella paludis]|uniref:Right-handed parallel beta-helix repeat-containing protein n=1 Tax=Ideonella paludis TaxID=1233411 RepID=A0ABS5DRT9_9BURK|nr:right-handed parallel beta-helix repeat-containing protein [Ideonella paludis]MBQ0933868.1 right-handed parallel beta-helix repeat-containing protein [Ideonella paludis]
MCPASSLAAPRAAAAPWARRRWPLAGLLALLTTALAACGGGDPPDTSAALLQSERTQAQAADLAPLATPLVWVGPASGAPAGAKVYSSLQGVPWASLAAGTLVQVAAGTYAGPVTITSQGTASAPIEIQAANAATPPLVTSAFDFQGAAHVRLKGFVVEGSPWGAVVLRRGSHHITVQGNSLRRSYMGVDVSDGAGEALNIEGNVIEDNQTHGLSVAQITTPTAVPSRISANTIRRNGHHGVELRSSRWVVEHNIVSDHGSGIGGATGIHLFSASPTEDSGDDNLIRYNFSFANRDRILHWDGNGIQADQWCDRNVIAYNVVWANDGAGIALFDASSNEVYGNTAHDNAQDTARPASASGEITLSKAASTATNRTTLNKVYNNTLSVKRSGATALTVDNAAAAGNNTLGPNLYAPHPFGTAVLRKGTQYAKTTKEVNSVTGLSGNAVEALSWRDASNPLGHGLALSRAPSKAGLKPTPPDMLGVWPAAGLRYFGAYYTPR